MSSRRIATRSLRRKMATAQAELAGVHVFSHRKGQKPSPASILPTSRGQCTPWNSPEAQLLVRGFGERSQHRLEHSEHEAGFALQWDEVILSCTPVDGMLLGPEWEVTMASVVNVF